MLLSVKEIDKDAKCALGLTALMWACERGHEKAVRALLTKQCSARIRATGTRDTALMLACRNNSKSVVRALLEWAEGSEDNIDIDGQNDAQYTALMIACERGHMKICERLLRVRAQVVASKS